MKRISLLVVAILLATISFAQVKKSPAPDRYGWDQEYPLYGDVKAVTITEYSVSDYFGEIVNNSIENLSAYVFDDKGNVVRYGQVQCGNMEYKYDSEGRLIEKIRYNGEELLEKCTLKYNLQGDTIEMIEYGDSENILVKFIYEYNDRGSLTAKTKYGSGGYWIEKEYYRYDSNYELLNYTLYGINNELKSSIIYTYDTKGRLVKKLESDGEIYDNGKVYYNICKKYEYDSRDNVIEELIYEDGELLYTYDYTYNALGQVKRKTHYIFPKSPGNLMEAMSHLFKNSARVSEVLYKYNNDNLLVSQVTHFAELKYDEVVEWEYDSNGSCIRKSVVKDWKNGNYTSEQECYVYDAVGNMIKSQKYNNEVLLETIVYEYDTTRNLIQKNVYNGFTMMPITQIEYDIAYSEEDVEFDQANFCVDGLDSDYKNEVEDEMDFVKVERMPSFMGGDLNTFRQWFGSEFKYPAIAAENGIQGRLVVRFIVEKDGRLTNIEFLQSPDPVFNDEVIRVLKKSPKWTPGYQGDKPVRVSYVLPIKLNLN